MTPRITIETEFDESESLFAKDATSNAPPLPEGLVFAVSGGGTGDAMESPETDIFLAAGRGDLPSLRRLLNADPTLAHQQHPDLGGTALHFAAAASQEQSAELLLKHGADPNAVDTFAQETPLCVALMTGAEAIIKLLLNHGADPNAPTLMGHFAARRLARLTG